MTNDEAHERAEDLTRLIKAALQEDEDVKLVTPDDETTLRVRDHEGAVFQVQVHVFSTGR